MQLHLMVVVLNSLFVVPQETAVEESNLFPYASSTSFIYNNIIILVLLIIDLHKLTHNTKYATKRIYRFKM